MRVDINSDLGESFGNYTIGMDGQVIPLLTSANVACGFHGGDPRVMEQTVALCKQHGVAVGAHPGYPDLVGFGRRAMDASPDEIRTDVLYQVGALHAFCKAAGVPLHHVKPHGALGNACFRDPVAARAVAEAVHAYDPGLLVYVLPGTPLHREAERLGLPVALEVYGDRAFNPDGTLVSRKTHGAMIHDPEQAVRQVLQMVLEGSVTAITGQVIPVRAETICVHGDNPAALELIRRIRAALTGRGVVLQPV